MKLDKKRFCALLDSGNIPNDYRSEYDNLFLADRFLDSIGAGILSLLVATRFKYKTWNSIVENWDTVISIANDSQTVGQLFRLYCFEKIDRNKHINVSFDKFVKQDRVKGSIISQIDNMVNKYQSSWHTEVIFGALAKLVSDYDKKKRGAVHTPLVLIREIFDKMPDVWGNGMVLDPACGNGPFLWETKQRCIANGCDEKTVVEDILLGIDIDRKKAYITSAVLDPKGLYESRIILANSLEFLDMEIWKMKFDVIVGNPPFQNSNSGNDKSKLYAEFTKISFDKLLKNNGILTLLTPKTLLRKTKRYFSLVDEKGLKSVNFTANDHFDVGVDIVAWELRKDHNFNTVEVTNKDKTISYAEHGSDIGDKDEQWLYDLMTRIKSKPIKAFCYNNIGPTRSLTPLGEYCYPLIQNIDKGSIVYSKKEPYYYQKNKMLISISLGYGKDNVLFDTKDYAEAFVCMDITNVTNKQLSNINSFLFNTLFVLLVKKYREIFKTGFANILVYLPVFDINKHYTDQDIIDFFELTNSDVHMLKK